VVSKEIRDRRIYIAELEANLKEQQGLLRHALLGPDALQREDEQIRSTNEYKVMRQRLEIVNATPSSDAEPVIKSTATAITDRIESARGNLTEKQKACCPNESTREY
jgi:hypothetical protein